MRYGEGLEVKTLYSKQGKINTLVAVAVIQLGDLECYSLGVIVFIIPVYKLGLSLVLNAFKCLELYLRQYYQP